MGKTAILSVRIISDAKDAIAGMKDAEGAAGGLGGVLSNISPGALAVGGAIVSGAVAAGKALYDLGSRFDDVADTIRVGTGATGDALDGLIDDAHKVATSIPTDFETAGQTVADLNTRMGLTGDTLQTVASQYLEAGRILGEDVDITTTSAAFSAFQITGDAVSGAMDDLFRVSQATGVGMNDLAGSVQGNALALQEMGFGFSDSIALIGGLDKAGIDADTTLNAMRKGLVNLAKPGQDMGSAFYEVTGQINQFIQAGDTASAVDLASQVFGTKGATQMVQALQTGLINTEDLTAAIGATGDTILGVGADTMDAAEKWQILKNKGMEALEPLASGIFDLVGKGLDVISGWVDGFDMSAVTGPASQAAPIIGTLGAGFNQVTSTIGPLASSIRDTLGPVITALAPIVSTQIGAITGIISGTITMITGIITVIRGILTGDWSMIWDGAKQIVSGAIRVITSYITGIQGMVSGIFGAIGGIIRNLWGQAWDWATSKISQGVSDIATKARQIPGKITGALSNAPSLLLNAGGQIIDGLINGITGAAGRLASKIQGVIQGGINAAKNALGIHSPSRVFREIGVNTADGLVLGINDKAGAVTKAWNSLVTIPAGPEIRLTGTPSAPVAPAPQINITINGVLDGDDAARKIEALLRRHDWRRGSVEIGTGR